MMFLSSSHTHVLTLKAEPLDTLIFAYQDAAHKNVHIHYKPSDNTARHTHPSLQTAVTALQAQLSKLRDFQHYNI